MKKLLLALLMVFSLGTVVKAAPQNGCPAIVGVVCLSANIQGIVPMPGQAQVGIAYNQSFTSVGSVGSVTWSTTSTATQNGLTLNTGSSASVTGSPTNTSADSWNIHWVDSVGRTFTGIISIQASALASVSIFPATANVNESQTQQFQAQAAFANSTFANVTSTATWSCISGPGCTGSTVVAGLFTAGTTAGSATVQASFGGQSGTAIATVVSPANPLTFQNNDPLPNGQKFQPYSELSTGNGSQGVGAGVDILVSGGTGPYTCSVSSGSLPTGLALTSANGNTNCLITGSPTVSGAGSSFTIQVADSASHTNTKVFSSGITVASLSSLAVNLGQSSISANAGTTASAVGTYSDSSTALLPAAGGPEVVATASANSGGATSKQLPTTATTTGWLAIAVVQSWNTSACSATTMSMTSPNETFTSVAAAVGQTGTPPPYVNCVQAFYAANITGANDAPTCNFSVADGGSCFVMYVTGMPTSSVLDQSPAGAVSTNGTATSCAPNSMTTTQANELLVHVCFPNSASSFTPPTGFTATFTSSAPDNAYQIDTQVANTIQTSVAPAASFSPAGNEVALLSSFKANTPAPGGVVWSSSNNVCAFAYPLGHIQGQSVNTQCTATITGTVGAVNNMATLTVTPNNTDTGIVVSPSNPSILVNGTQQFTANGNVTNQQYTAAWGSSNTSVATINSSSGLATCIEAGSVNISAAVSGFTSASTTLTCTTGGGGGGGRIFYIDAVSGSNSHTVTQAQSKSTPWQSAPYMIHSAGCDGSTVPSGYTHQVGDHFIFKGGVTWPYTCFGMTIAAGGNASTPDYYGVDQTWFTGSSWTRPIFDLTQHTVGTPCGGQVIAICDTSGSVQYVTVDNLEIKNQGIYTGVQGNSDSYRNQCAIGFGSQAPSNFGYSTGTLVENVYIHAAFIATSTTTTPYATNSNLGYCAGGIGGAAIVDHVEINGDDSSDAGITPTMSNLLFFMGGTLESGEVRFSKIHGTINGCDMIGIGGTQRSCHDNEFYHVSNAGQDGNNGGIHSHIIYDNDGSNTSLLVYNNAVHDSFAGLNISVDNNAWVYNNVEWNLQNNVGVYTFGQSVGTNYFFNNTIDMTADGSACFGGNGTTPVAYIYNNICIGASGLGGPPATTTHSGTNYPMGNTEATNFGFTAANKYAPTSSDSHVAGAGTNIPGAGLGLSCTAQLLNLCSDTSGAPWFGGTYQTRQPPPTAWSLGAYKNP